MERGLPDSLAERLAHGVWRVVPGCGGDAAERDPTAAPTIERPVARQLPVAATKLLRLLEAGDNRHAPAQSAWLSDEPTVATNRHHPRVNRRGLRRP